MLTDFGLKSSYVSQMKGVALSLTNAKIIDISHEISPHNILEGAFVLKNAVKYFPPGTVHVAVVDPGVGTDRRGIVVTTQTQIFVGPDNGLLIPAAKSIGSFNIYNITNVGYMIKNVTNTFHGRDIFTPVAAHILNGVLFEEIGPKIKDYIDLDFGRGEITKRTASGKIIHIDNFGNIITNIEGEKLKQVLDFDKKILLSIGKKIIEIPFVKSYNFVKKDQLLATIGSSNYLEICQNQSNANINLKFKIGDEISFTFI
jgi:S-adenosylmethionine hydrolase